MHTDERRPLRILRICCVAHCSTGHSLDEALTVYRTPNDDRHHRVDLIFTLPETYWTAGRQVDRRDYVSEGPEVGRENGVCPLFSQHRLISVFEQRAKF